MAIESPSCNELLQDRWSDGKLLGINLDPNPKLIPAKYFDGISPDNANRFDQSKAMEKLLSNIIPATAPDALIYKINLAFFEDNPYFSSILGDLMSAIRYHTRDHKVPI